MKEIDIGLEEFAYRVSGVFLDLDLISGCLDVPTFNAVSPVGRVNSVRYIPVIEYQCCSFA